MSTAPCVSSLTGGVRAPVARPPTRGARSCVTATRATSFSPSADRLSISGDVEADGRVVVVAADSEKRRGNLVDALKRSAAAVAAAAVVATAQPDAACANGYEPPPPTNGPAARLPRELTEPDEIFRESFTVKFAGLEVDHKLLVGSIILGQGIGFVGSVVGGNEARRKGEQVKALNASLLKVNAELRREMREAGLGPYVPIPTQRFIEKPAGMSTDEDDAVATNVVMTLKCGKRKLKEADNAGALAEFTTALRDIEANPKSLAEAWKAERKAHRGMGAALERMGRFDDALKSMETVLRLSVEHSDHSGETDALGVIADIYTDMDRLEEAAEYYDRYFTSLQEEDARMQTLEKDESEVEVAAR